MKFLKFLLISTFLVLFASSAYAMNFGIDVNSNGTLDFGYGDEVLETGYGAVALSLDAASLIEAAGASLGDSGSFSGTFKELAGGYIPVIDFAATNYEMTYLLSATGNFSVDYSVTATGVVLTNHAFGFTDGTIEVYVDDSREWTSGAQPTLASDGKYFGSNDGTKVGTFELTNGSGTLQVAGGAADSVDIWALSDDITSGIFFFEEGDKDFADVVLQAGIFVQMYVNTSNEENPANDAAFLAEVADAGALFPASTDYDFLVAVETDGSIEFSVVPEPGTMILFGLGLLGFAGFGRRRIKA